jgi:hypothetical protein
MKFKDEGEKSGLTLTKILLITLLLSVLVVIELQPLDLDLTMVISLEIRNARNVVVFLVPHPPQKEDGLLPLLQFEKGLPQGLDEILWRCFEVLFAWVAM